MHFNSVLISCFLFAFAALAVETSTVYSGAVWQNQTDRTFDYVLGILIVPEARRTSENEAFATMEIIFDNAGSCPSGATFRLGVNLHVAQDDSIYNQALYEWYPDPVQKFDIPGGITTGNTIQLRFIAYSTTSGEVFVDNLSTSQSVNMTVNSEHPLCGRAAGWVVQDESNNDRETTLANFGGASFTQAKAGIVGEFHWGPLGATPVQFSGLPDAGDSQHIMGSVMSYDNGSTTITFVTGGVPA